ncbi:hypothetical protein RJ639_014471 [Escallonia herrerae]|uniref:Uncharacterized protein n=1 Tax=Escallonia herrerae TaxID=1293975 RepID=A0AA89ANQ4_9ASTE|nr:hypothetical protein RJ639_014471 [Escallonia herrerae]
MEEGTSVIGTAPNSGEVVVNSSNEGAKRQRVDRCFSFVEVSVDPGIKSLKHLDSTKFKNQIRRWAKAVVGYARQNGDALFNVGRNRAGRASYALQDEQKCIQDLLATSGPMKASCYVTLRK